jgi:hypothetical protein
MCGARGRPFGEPFYDAFDGRMRVGSLVCAASRASASFRAGVRSVRAAARALFVTRPDSRRGAGNPAIL